MKNVDYIQNRIFLALAGALLALALFVVYLGITQEMEPRQPRRPEQTIVINSESSN